MLTYLGDLGGLIDFVLLMGWLITTVFAGKLFEAALIGASYKIQSYTRDFSQYYKTREINKISSEISASQISPRDSSQKGDLPGIDIEARAVSDAGLQN